MLTPAFESTVPGLYFIGAASAPTFGPVMRFMFGAKHPAAPGGAADPPLREKLPGGARAIVTPAAKDAAEARSG